MITFRARSEGCQTTVIDDHPRLTGRAQKSNDPNDANDANDLKYPKSPYEPAFFRSLMSLRSFRSLESSPEPRGMETIRQEPCF